MMFCGGGEKSGSGPPTPAARCASRTTSRDDTTMSLQLNMRPATRPGSAVSSRQTASATSLPCTSLPARAGTSLPASASATRSNHLLRSCGTTAP